MKTLLFALIVVLCIVLGTWAYMRFTCVGVYHHPFTADITEIRMGITRDSSTSEIGECGYDKFGMQLFFRTYFAW